MDDFYTQLFEGTNSFNPNINLGFLFKIPLVVFVLGNLFYAFMLVLKIKILIDTIDSEGNSKMRALAYTNLIISIVGAVLGFILILLG